MVDHISTAVESYTETLTEGDFVNEDDAKKALRSMLHGCNDFVIAEEMECWYYGTSPFVNHSTGKLDFVLIPKKPATDFGWRNGVIAIEVKKSGHKVGPLICQMMDYAKSVIEFPNSGIKACVSAVFCFPSFVAKNEIESVCVNNRIGNCKVRREVLVGNIGGTNIFEIGGTPPRLVKSNRIVAGHKTGSR